MMIVAYWSIICLISCLLLQAVGRKSSSNFERPRKLIKDRKEEESEDDNDFEVEIQNEDVTDFLSTSSNRKRKIIIPVRKEPLTTRLFKTAASLQSTITESSQKALQKISSINRNIKAYFASDFESLLLRLTIPDDIQPIETDVSTFLATTKSFLYNRDLKSPNNPYRVTLRKLWAKITEDDPRTNIKALYLLHFLLKFSELNDSKIFQKLFYKMQKEKNEKKNQFNYYEKKWFQKKWLQKLKDFPFPSSALLEGKRGGVGEGEGGGGGFIASTSVSYQQFLIKYYDYIWKRFTFFTSNFSELKQIHYEQKIEDICLTICKGLQLLKAGMKCAPSISEENELTVIAMELIAHDSYELYQDLKVKIEWIIKEDEVGDIFQNWSQKEINSFLYFVKSAFNECSFNVKDFIKETAQVLELYNVDFPFSIDHVVQLEITEEEIKQKDSFNIKEFVSKVGKKEEVKAMEDNS